VGRSRRRGRFGFQRRFRHARLPDRARRTVVVSGGGDSTSWQERPDTLVVVGSTTYNSRTYWSAAAFTSIDGDLAQADTATCSSPRRSTAPCSASRPATGGSRRPARCSTSTATSTRASGRSSS
jgi:hypothetical protein